MLRIDNIYSLQFYDEDVILASPMTPIVAEFIGTFILIALGHAVNANVLLTGTKGNGSGWILISIGWGLAVFCAVAVAGPFSGAHINPAVTFGLAIAGLFSWSDVLPYVTAQILGAALGAFVIWLNFKDHFDKEENPSSKLGVFATAPQIRNFPINFFNELTGTFFLVFVLLYIAAPEVEGQRTEIVVGLGSIGALPVGFLVMIIGMGLGGTTGYAINPARDLGPRIMHAILPIQGKGSSDWSYSWIPILGPLSGAFVAYLVHMIIS